MVPSSSLRGILNRTSEHYDTTFQRPHIMARSPSVHVILKVLQSCKSTCHSRYSHAMLQCEAVAESAETRLELVEEKLPDCVQDFPGMSDGVMLVVHVFSSGLPTKWRVWKS